MPAGEITGRVARKLAQKLAPRGFDVLFDHGDSSIDSPDRLGEIVAWFGPQYNQKARLAVLDIAVVSRDTGKVLALVEVEESSATPKTLLGDVFATLLGESFMFQGRRELDVNDRTVLIVLLCAKTGGKREQILAVRDRLGQLLPLPRTLVKRVKIDAFASEAELEEKLFGMVEGMLLK
jgi:hypothetical protein